MTAQTNLLATPARLDFHGCDSPLIEALIAMSEQPTAIFAEDGRILYANSRFRRHTGLDGLGDAYVHDLDSQLNAPHLVQTQWLTLPSGEKWEGRFWLKHAASGKAVLTAAQCTAFTRLLRAGDCECRNFIVTFAPRSAAHKEFGATALRLLQPDIWSEHGQSQNHATLAQLAATLNAAHQTGQMVGIIEILVEHPARAPDPITDSMQVHVCEEILDRLRNCGRPGDLVIAIAHNVYLVALVGIVTEHGLDAIAHRLVHEIHRSIEIGGRTMILAASAGVALFPMDGVSVADLLRRTDAALLQACRPQSMHHRAVVRYRSSIDEHAAFYRMVERDLRKALGNGQVSLFYQPIIEIETGKGVGAEALLRWFHPTWGLVGPADFLPQAESMGLMTEIGLWTLREAFGFVSRHEHLLPAGFTVSVNLSAHSIPREIQSATIARLLEDTGCSPERVAIEITESTWVQPSPDTSAWFDAVARQGIRIDLDDFGVGYSALASIAEYPIRRLKIDRSLVAGLHRDTTSRAIVKAAIDMAHALGVQVVGEGVEEPGQAQALKALGCQYGQGFFLGRPAPEEDLLGRLRGEKFEKKGEGDAQQWMDRIGDYGDDSGARGLRG